MRRDQLPPLKSLLYFEAAASARSFTRAADALNVTQGAVSRQVRQLEGFLGKPLFRRAERSVFLTDAGEDYYLTVRHLLDQLQVATRALRHAEEVDQVTVATSSALASLYLLPRLPAFRRSEPDVQIRILARDQMSGLNRADFDLALYFCREAPDEASSHRLFEEVVFPVCSPDYLRRNPGQFSNPAGLCRNLIWQETDEHWINWPDWLEAMGLDVHLAERRLVVTDYPMVVQAAIAGEGVALGWGNLIDRYLASGELVKPTEHTLATGNGFYAISRPAGMESNRVRAVMEWLLEGA